MTARIERLQRGEGARWRRIRLQALADAPSAFGTTHAEASQWPDERWEAHVARFATFVAVAEERDVGVVRAAPHRCRDARELISLWVAPSARRHGIGAQLVERVAACARAAGAAVLVLDVAPDNAPAIALYERTGFVRFDGAAMGEIGPGEIRLVRSLAP